jgi:hypothetical protein
MNTPVSMVVTELGIVMDVSPDSWKALFPMVCTDVPKSIVVKLIHLPKAHPPIDVTELGIVMEFKSLP